MMIRPSTSGSTTFIVRSVGERPRVDSAHASSDIPAKVTCSTGRSPPSSTVPANSPPGCDSAKAVAFSTIAGACSAKTLGDERRVLLRLQAGDIERQRLEPALLPAPRRAHRPAPSAPPASARGRRRSRPSERLSRDVARRARVRRSRLSGASDTRRSGSAPSRSACRLGALADQVRAIAQARWRDSPIRPRRDRPRAFALRLPATVPCAASAASQVASPGMTISFDAVGAGKPHRLVEPVAPVGRAAEQAHHDQLRVREHLLGVEIDRIGMRERHPVGEAHARKVLAERPPRRGEAGNLRVGRRRG